MQANPTFTSQQPCIAADCAQALWLFPSYHTPSTDVQPNGQSLVNATSSVAVSTATPSKPGRRNPSSQYKGVSYAKKPKSGEQSLPYLVQPLANTLDGTLGITLQKTMQLW